VDSFFQGETGYHDPRANLGFLHNIFLKVYRNGVDSLMALIAGSLILEILNSNNSPNIRQKPAEVFSGKPN
jgi:hypothetical protein